MGAFHPAFVPLPFLHSLLSYKMNNPIPEAKPQHNRRAEYVTQNSKLSNPSIWDYFKKEPLIAGGVLATCGVLFAGFRTLWTGNQRQSQNLMRGRVLAQGKTHLLCGVVLNDSTFFLMFFLQVSLFVAALSILYTELIILKRTRKS